MGGMGGRRGCGCGLEAIVIVVFIFIAIWVVGDMLEGGLFGSTAQIPPSTIERTRLTTTASGSNLTFEDASSSGDWFPDYRRMVTGADTAYRLTGVKFGIYVANDIDGNTRPTDAMMNEFTDELYSDWFGDSAGHFLLVLIDLNNENYAAWYAAGSMASTIFDNQALDIFFGYLDIYWDAGPENYTNSEMFANTLSKTAERIMNVSKTPLQLALPWIFGLVAIIIVFIGINTAIKANTKRKLAEAEKSRADAALLNTPIAGLDGSPPSDPLLDKYNNPPNQ
jgi:hypothetical protein